MDPETRVPDGKDDSRKRGFLFPFFCGLLLVVFVALMIHFEKVKNKYENQLREVDPLYSIMQKDLDRVNQIKEKRAKTVAKAYLKSFPAQYTFSAADFIRRLSLVLPSNIRIITLEVVGNLQSFNFFVVGFLSKASKGSDLQNFINRLRELEKVSKVNLKYTPGQLHSARKSRIEFIISGEVELE